MTKYFAVQVGDLSGKYGTFDSQAAVDQTYTDYNIQLFGPNSIVDRSFVIHKAAGGKERSYHALDLYTFIHSH